RRVAPASAAKSCATWPDRRSTTTMSRVAKKPIALPKGVELNIQPESVSAKGPKGMLSLAKPAGVQITVQDGQAVLSANDPSLIPMAGTVRAILANMV